MLEASLLEDSAVVMLMVEAEDIFKCVNGHHVQKDVSFLIFPSMANEPFVDQEPAAFTEMQIFQGLHYYFFIPIFFSLEMSN